MEDFLIRNEAQIITTVSAFFVAVVSVFLTQKVAAHQSKKQKKRVYQGVLNTLWVELLWHKNTLKLLRNSLTDMKLVCINHGSFIIKSPITIFDLVIIEKSIQSILDFNDSNHKIAVFSNAYRNLVRQANSFLDFHNAAELINFTPPESRTESIEHYFDVLESDYFKKMELYYLKIEPLILQELVDYKKIKDVISDKGNNQ